VKFTLTIDALAAAGRRRLAYWKSMWEVAARPYASPTFESIVRDNFERATALADLTASELRSRGQTTAEYSKKVVTQIGKMQGARSERFATRWRCMLRR
jgi:hypothetical protein